MIFLRLLALLAGSLVLIVPPLLMAGNSRPDMPIWLAVGGLAGMAMIALSFFFIAARGDRMRRSSQTRTLGGLLLLVPAVTGIVTLLTRKDAGMLWGSGALLSFTVLLYLAFDFPAAPNRRQRPMRRRERGEPRMISEPTLVIVQRHPSTERRGARF
jgi:hypothetical protein